MKRRHLACATLVAALLAPAAAHAALEVNATLSQDRVNVGDVVTLEVVAVSTSNDELEIEVPRLDGLDELRRGQSDSTSVSWTGQGQSLRRERTLRVDYEARKPGTLTLSGIRASLGRESRTAPPLKLVVVGSAEPDRPPEPGMVPTPGQVAPPEDREGDLFVRYRADRAEAFVGEQIILDLEIFTAGNYGLDDTPPRPTLDGFWREILEQPNHLVARNERVAGRTYRVYRLWRVALFGLEPGDHAIPAVQVGFSSNRSIFSPGTRVRRSTPPLTIKILPLPSAGRPADFAGTNVGLLTLEARVDAQVVDAGKGVTLRLVLGGAGNIANLRPPEPKAIDGFRVFPPRLSDAIDRTLSGVTGSKTAEILLVPTRTGPIEIPSISASVFDPEKKTYESLSTAPISIQVSGTIQAAPPVAPPPSSAPTRPTDVVSTLRPIRVERPLITEPRFLGSRTFWALLFAPVLAFGALAGGLLLVRRPRTESARERLDRQEAEHRARLAQAANDADAGRGREAFAHAAEALVDIYALRSGVALRGLTTADQRSALAERGVPEGVLRAFFETLEGADFARFAPSAGLEGEARSFVARVQRLVDEGWSPRRPS